MDKTGIERVLSDGFPPAADDTRESLLKRCVAIVNLQEGVEISDEELDMLAAAGDMSVLLRQHEIGQKPPWENS